MTIELNKKEIEMILYSLNVVRGMHKSSKYNYEAFNETDCEGYVKDCKVTEEYKNLIMKITKEVFQES